VDLSQHAAPLVSRLPEMVRAMAQYSRSSFDPDHAVLRCYLPRAAGANLAMATQLAAAEFTSGAQRARLHHEAPREASLDERLQRVTSLRIPRDTLEASLEQLGADIGVDFEIDGAALQADGITKNQSLSIDVSDLAA